jgi:hypothetical protein
MRRTAHRVQQGHPLPQVRPQRQAVQVLPLLQGHLLPQEQVGQVRAQVHQVRLQRQVQVQPQVRPLQVAAAGRQGHPRLRAVAERLLRQAVQGHLRVQGQVERVRLQVLRAVPLPQVRLQPQGRVVVLLPQGQVAVHRHQERPQRQAAAGRVQVQVQVELLQRQAVQGLLQPQGQVQPQGQRGQVAHRA